MFRLIRDTDAAAQIDEFDFYAEPLFYFDTEIEEDIRRVDKKIGIEFIRSDHRMESESFDAFVFAARIGFEKLFARQAVFRFFGFSDNRVAALLERAGIVAKTEPLR